MTITVHTFTALQLKADTSPKPSTPYYCDISNLSWPMTGLMIMFPVLFQLQITANSVITGLLCQPSSGPLTVGWPGAVFSPLQSAWTWGVDSPTKSLKKKKTHNRELQLPITVFWQPICSRWTRISSTWSLLFSLEPSLIEVLSRQVIITISTSRTGQMTLEPGPIVLAWSSFIALLTLTRSFFTQTPFLMPVNFVGPLGGQTCWPPNAKIGETYTYFFGQYIKPKMCIYIDPGTA